MPPSTQPQAPSLSRHIAAALAVILVLTALILIILQNVPFGKSRLIKTYADGYREGFTRARDLATQGGAQAVDERDMLSGTVTKVSADAITFEAAGLIMDEKVDPAGTIRVARVTTETELVAHVPRPDEEFEADYERYLAQVQSTGSDDGQPAPPMSYTEEQITPQNIAVGDRVTVWGTPEQNLIPLASFDASRMVVVPTPPVPDADMPLHEARNKDASSSEE